MGGRRYLVFVAALVVILGSVWATAHNASRQVPRSILTHDAFYRLPTTAKLVALTFDDGPDALITPKVLQMLDRYHAHATFFVTGQHSLAHPDLVRRELASGNEVGNHTFDHAFLTRISRAAAAAEITRADAVFATIGVPKPALFRPPHGVATFDLLRHAVADGHKFVLWSLAVEHFSMHESVDRADADLLRRVRPGDIILAHDCCKPFNRQTTIDVLDRLIPQLQARGYGIVTVSTLMAAARLP